MPSTVTIDDGARRGPGVFQIARLDDVQARLCHHRAA